MLLDACRRPEQEDILQAASSGNTLRELRLTSSAVTGEIAAHLAPIAGRLHVLHLKW